MTVGVTAADGSVNVTVVDGTLYTGLYAADGSYNVVVSDGSTFTGYIHPCGGLNVVVYTSGQPTRYTPSGGLYVSESPYTPGTVPVTVVSGSLDANALTLAWDEDTTDPTPDFTLTGATDLQVGDIIRLTIGVTDYDNTIDGSELAELSFAFATGVLANGAYSARAYHRRGGSDIASSNTEAFTINDTVAPVLSSPVDTKTDATSGTGSVSTTKATGTLYWVVSTSATAPSAAQVKLGQTHAGVAATDSGSQSVTATGVQSVTGGFTGLTASTTYYAHYMHEDIGPNQSTVSSGDGFTTDSLSPLTYIDTQSVQKSYGGTSHSFNFDFGSFSGTKTAVLAFFCGNAGTMSMTVGGAAATLVVSNNNLSLWRIDITSGGVTAVVATSTNALSSVIVSASYLSGMVATPTATDYFASAARLSPAVLLNASSGNGVGTQSVPSGGVAVGVSRCAANTVSIVVTGATQHADLNFSSTPNATRYAFYSTSVDADPSVAFSSYAGDGHLIAVWGP